MVVSSISHPLTFVRCANRIKVEFSIQSRTIYARNEKYIYIYLYLYSIRSLRYIYTLDVWYIRLANWSNINLPVTNILKIAYLLFNFAKCEWFIVDCMRFWGYYAIHCSTCFKRIFYMKYDDGVSCFYYFFFNFFFCCHTQATEFYLRYWNKPIG